MAAVRIVRLLARHHRLLFESFLLVLRVRVGLSLRGQERVRQALCVLEGSRHAPAAHDVAPLAWSVRQAARLVPRATCLTQAIAGQALLTRRGCPSIVRVGVRRSHAGEFQAHAWLLHEGRAILGARHEPGPDFVPLADFGPVR
ncbi:lasso peptide biosynthesis B2 protein [Aureimonas populi]|uniref:Lasso peptide biosynthesis B2 protein n=1 Tax=Aureimonas populi TaxID=1701758 RepID=A0ABW5CQ69_9HYPH|nr:lasso peptide biosynthesis B2 protein [Aureimonas populi]